MKDVLMKLVFNILLKFYGLHNDLPFLPKLMEIESTKKRVANLHDKADYVILIRNLKQAFNHRLIFKKF